MISLEQKLDKKNVTPTDFAVIVTGLPKKTTTEEIKKYFEDNVEDS